MTDTPQALANAAPMATDLAALEAQILALKPEGVANIYISHHIDWHVSMVWIDPTTALAASVSVWDFETLESALTVCNAKRRVAIETAQDDAAEAADYAAFKALRAKISTQEPKP